jgi:ribosomal protein S13
LEQITSGEVTIASVIARADHDAVVAKTRISKIVQAVPGWGSTRATALLKRLGIAEGRRVAGLEANQAEALIDALSRTAGLLPGAAERIGPCKQDRGRE